MTGRRIDLGCNEIADLYLSGKSAVEIGKIFGVSHKPILLRLRESGIEIRDARQVKNIIGQRFGKWLVLNRAPKQSESHAYWVCKCACGTVRSVQGARLRFGQSMSCGCISAERRGAKSLNWNPNLTDEERLKNRQYPEYNEWRKAVFERDGYACQKCGEGGKRLRSHHIESYRDNPELRTTLENGVTLCKKHHDDFHHQFGYGDNTREQFEQFLLGGEKVKQNGPRT